MGFELMLSLAKKGAQFEYGFIGLFFYWNFSAKKKVYLVAI
jgi:hypothetical protein